VAGAFGCPVRMDSWEVVEPLTLKPAGYITGAFLKTALAELRTAARFITLLPYRRCVDLDNPLSVFIERCGTCSTKHALMRRLAIEQELEVALVLGIYEMSGDNTPGIGPVLRQYRLASLPEAHCYLRIGTRRIDLTRARTAQAPEPIFRFLYEEDIEPGQIGHYKVKLHQRFLKMWSESPESNNLSLDKLWHIRELCISSLSAHLVL
jgi:hypothetical protein